MAEVSTQELCWIREHLNCPACRKGDLMEGPWGGCAVNVRCRNCGRKYGVGIFMPGRQVVYVEALGDSDDGVCFREDTTLVDIMEGRHHAKPEPWVEFMARVLAAHHFHGAFSHWRHVFGKGKTQAEIESMKLRFKDRADEEVNWKLFVETARQALNEMDTVSPFAPEDRRSV